ncbi:hypothetical protein KIPB_006316, partial [Kipferlia bialata]
DLCPTLVRVLSGEGAVGIATVLKILKKTVERLDRGAMSEWVSLMSRSRVLSSVLTLVTRTLSTSCPPSPAIGGVSAYDTTGTLTDGSVSVSVYDNTGREAQGVEASGSPSFRNGFARHTPVYLSDTLSQDGYQTLQQVLRQFLSPSMLLPLETGYIATHINIRANTPPEALLEAAMHSENPSAALQLLRGGILTSELAARPQKGNPTHSTEAVKSLVKGLVNSVSEMLPLCGSSVLLLFLEDQWDTVTRPAPETADAVFRRHFPEALLPDLVRFRAEAPGLVPTLILHTALGGGTEGGHRGRGRRDGRSVVLPSACLLVFSVYVFPSPSLPHSVAAEPEPDTAPLSVLSSLASSVVGAYSLSQAGVGARLLESCKPVLLGGASRYPSWHPLLCDLLSRIGPYMGLPAAKALSALLSSPHPMSMGGGTDRAHASLFDLCVRMSARRPPAVSLSSQPGLPSRVTAKLGWTGKVASLTVSAWICLSPPDSPPSHPLAPLRSGSPTPDDTYTSGSSRDRVGSVGGTRLATQQLFTVTHHELTCLSVRVSPGQAMTHDAYEGESAPPPMTLSLSTDGNSRIEVTPSPGTVHPGRYTHVCIVHSLDRKPSRNTWSHGRARVFVNGVLQSEEELPFCTSLAVVPPSNPDTPLSDTPVTVAVGPADGLWLSRLGCVPHALSDLAVFALASLDPAVPVCMPQLVSGETLSQGMVTRPQTDSVPLSLSLAKQLVYSIVSRKSEYPDRPSHHSTPTGRPWELDTTVSSGGTATATSTLGTQCTNPLDSTIGQCGPAVCGEVSLHHASPLCLGYPGDTGMCYIPAVVAQGLREVLTHSHSGACSFSIGTARHSREGFKVADTLVQSRAGGRVLAVLRVELAPAASASATSAAPAPTAYLPGVLPPCPGGPLSCVPDAVALLTMVQSVSVTGSVQRSASIVRGVVHMLCQRMVAYPSATLSSSTGDMLMSALQSVAQTSPSHTLPASVCRDLFNTALGPFADCDSLSLSLPPLPFTAVSCQAPFAASLLIRGMLGLMQERGRVEQEQASPPGSPGMSPLGVPNTGLLRLSDIEELEESDLTYIETEGTHTETLTEEEERGAGGDGLESDATRYVSPCVYALKRLDALLSSLPGLAVSQALPYDRSNASRLVSLLHSQGIVLTLVGLVLDSCDDTVGGLALSVLGKLLVLAPRAEDLRLIACHVSGMSGVSKVTREAVVIGQDQPYAVPVSDGGATKGRSTRGTGLRQSEGPNTPQQRAVEGEGPTLRLQKVPVFEGTIRDRARALLLGLALSVLEVNVYLSQTVSATDPKHKSKISRAETLPPSSLLSPSPLVRRMGSRHGSRANISVAQVYLGDSGVDLGDTTPVSPLPDLIPFARALVKTPQMMQSLRHEWSATTLARDMAQRKKRHPPLVTTLSVYAEIFSPSILLSIIQAPDASPATVSMCVRMLAALCSAAQASPNSVTLLGPSFGSDWSEAQIPVSLPRALRNAPTVHANGLYLTVLAWLFGTQLPSPGDTLTLGGYVPSHPDTDGSDPSDTAVHCTSSLMADSIMM